MNNDTNGNFIKIPFNNVRDESGKRHGYLAPSDGGTPPTRVDQLIPNTPDTRATNTSRLKQARQMYLNTNYSSEPASRFGRQTVDHLQHEKLNGDYDVSTQLSSFYNWPSRTRAWDADVYTVNPKSGVAFEYLTLAPAHALSATAGKTGRMVDKFKLNSESLEKYFDWDSSGRRNQNKILSTPQTGSSIKRQIVKADTVNALFKELNQLAVKISATLCGEYKIEINPGEIYSVPSPMGGLGYPMFSSWYFGTKGNGTKYLTNGITLNSGTGDWSSGNIESTNGGPMTNVSNLLNNGCQIGSEDYDNGNTPIRAGMLYYGGVWPYGTEDLQKNALNNFIKLAEWAHSPMFPCAYNRFDVYHSTGDYDHASNFKARDLNGVSLPGIKHDMLTTGAVLPFGGNTISIVPEVLTNVHQQMFNRYCFMEPEDISCYYNDTHLTAGYAPSKLNINTQYLFAPYMLWLSKLAHANNNKMYNGTIRNATNTSSVAVYLKGGNTKYINPAAGIPVLFIPRNQLWVGAYATRKLTQETRDSYNVFTKIGKLVSNGVYEGTAQLQPFTQNKKGDTRYYQDLCQNYTIDSIDYLISAACSVNEVINTHYGRAYTSFSLSTGGSYTTDTVYSNTSHSGDREGDVDKRSSGNISPSSTKIASKINCLKNGYGKSDVQGLTDLDNQNLTTQLTAAIDDILAISYAKRFKFNDFYEDFHPCSYSTSLPKDSINKFFIASGNNEYVQGNVTRVFSWQTRISTDASTLPTFNVLHYLTHDNTEKIIQGTFAMVGNQTDVISTNIEISLPDGVNPSTTDGKIHYKFAPQPFPIESSSILYDKPKSLLKFSGTCKRFWNNLSNITCKLYAKNTTSTTTTAFTKVLSVSDEFQPKENERNRPCAEFQPRKSYTVPCAGDSSSLCKVTYNSGEDNYELELSAHIPITDIAQCSCTLRFQNDNFGFRDVCLEKSNCTINEATSFPILIKTT